MMLQLWKQVLAMYIHFQIKKLIKLRNENSALHNLSAFEFVSSDGYPLVYKRSSDKQTVYVFINPSDKAVTVNADYAKGGKAIYTLGENGSVKEDTVTGIVYEISDNFGVFVAVDYKYSAMIPRQEAQGGYKVGEEVTCRVSAVREDGKLTLSPKKKAYLQIYEDAENVLETIKEFDGVLPFDDKAAPELIQREFGLSKNAFKRAVGHLLKEKKVELKEGKICIK